MRLKDKVALITGGAAGIGKATAKRFIEEGAQVVICDVKKEEGEAAVQELGPQAEFYRVDVTDRQAVQAWVDGVVDKYGRVDVLINNAGVLRDNVLVRVKDSFRTSMHIDTDEANAAGIDKTTSGEIVK